MRKSAKIITALSVTGLAVVAGSAFTGAGLINDAGTTQFVGGTVSQTVTGATLTKLVYGFTNVEGANAQTAVNKVTLTFDSAAIDKKVQLSLGTAGAANDSFTCTDVVAVDGVPTSICSAPSGQSQAGVTSASVTVVSVNKA